MKRTGREQNDMAACLQQVESAQDKEHFGRHQEAKCSVTPDCYLMVSVKAWLAVSVGVLLSLA